MPRDAKIRKNPRGEKWPDARERGACLDAKIRKNPRGEKWPDARVRRVPRDANYLFM